MSEEEVAAVTEADAEVVTKEEMLDLVRAIKFAKPDASMREVHREITERLSQNESFEFLETIKLNDVKKVWKKAVAASAAKRSDDNNADIKSLLPQDNDVWKLYTVGDGSVKTLAESYSQATAKAVAEELAREQRESSAVQQALMDNYVHVFLDVPANLSGQRPHQALINFNENKTGAKDKDKKTKAGSSNAGDDDAIMVKIQVAASADGEKHPMLLYCQDRSMKTFIHPNPEDDGYDRIRTWIVSGGSGGALGAAGGTKAYFNTRVSKRKHGADVLSIDTRELAPPQSW